MVGKILEVIQKPVNYRFLFFYTTLDWTDNSAKIRLAHKK